jgi:hypothetical protein
MCFKSWQPNVEENTHTLTHTHTHAYSHIHTHTYTQNEFFLKKNFTFFVF